MREHTGRELEREGDIGAGVVIPPAGVRRLVAAISCRLGRPRDSLSAHLSAPARPTSLVVLLAHPADPPNY